MAFSMNNKGFIGLGFQYNLDDYDYSKAVYEFDPLKN
jgi:hypothetical protein